MSERDYRDPPGPNPLDEALEEIDKLKAKCADLQFRLNANFLAEADPIDWPARVNEPIGANRVWRSYFRALLSDPTCRTAKEAAEMADKSLEETIRRGRLSYEKIPDASEAE